VLFVTGTSTDVGKTVVTAALAALGLQRGSVAVVKPGQTGEPDGGEGDLAEVVRLAGPVSCHELVRYPDPLSPAAAARLSGREPLDPARLYELLLGLTEDLVLVEGAGGLLVRYDEDGLTLADLARALRARVLVVVGPHLGTLNHTALTLEALAHRGLELEGLVLGSWPAEPGLAERSTLRDLEMLAARPLLGALPAGAPQAGDFLTVARESLCPQLGGTWDPREFRRTWDPPLPA
jgi:dethiobiotin synthetase